MNSLSATLDLKPPTATGTRKIKYCTTCHIRRKHTLHNELL